MDPAADRGAHERDVGLRGHATTTPGLGGRLRLRISDFLVDEVTPRPAEVPRGRVTAFRVRLTNWETNAFVREASQRLGVSRKRVRFTGTKDKRSVSTQWFTADVPPAALDALEGLHGVDVLDRVRVVREAELGDHQANRFQVVLRDVQVPVDEAQRIVEATWDQLAAFGGAPNVFGPQRFGARRATTHRVGERMVRGDFLGAVRAYLAGPVHVPDDAGRRAWSEALEAGDWKALLRLAGDDARFERALLHRLVETDGDALLALRALPENLQRLFVYAFQSWMYNDTLMDRLHAGLPFRSPLEGDLVAPVDRGRATEEWTPVAASNLDRVRIEAARGRALATALLPGTEAPLAGGAMGGIERAVLERHRVSPRDFLVPEHVEWSSKGTRRPLLAPARDFHATAAPDDQVPGATCVTFTFELPPGAYATTVIREFSKSPWMTDYA